jgi:hypothetical protein
VAFSVEFAPKGEPEGCEWKRGERGSAPPRDWNGQQLLLQKDTIMFLLDDLAVVQFEGLASSKGIQCDVLPGAVSLNKLFVNTECKFVFCHPCGKKR